ncbi:MAG: DNA-directed RNA polymerase subunit D [Methanotrichaceae archaeon]|nr:DNA-directed RNA polymerase subunit D [Methanotrichaceae archaeon]
MKVDLLELKEDRIAFILSGVTAAFANGIRRACLSEVPILAIDELAIYENTSVLFDEQIALRMGLIPIQTNDLDIFSLPEECQCGENGCPGCRVDFMLSAEGPRMVYSRDIQFQDPDIRPALEEIPIVILSEGEKVVIEGFASMRRGRDHSKWNSGTLCGYKNLPLIEIDACNGCAKCVQVCPRKVLAIEENRVKAVNPVDCSLCKLCIDACEARAIKVKPILDSFVLTIECAGSISSRDLVVRATQEIKKRAKAFDTKLGELF